jgi:hypothetical protein
MMPTAARGCPRRSGRSRPGRGPSAAQQPGSQTRVIRWWRYSVGMLKLTLGHNCIIDLDEDRQPQASCLRELLALHDAGSLQIRLTAVSAAEKPDGKPHLTNLGEFQQRLGTLGIERLELLKPIAYLGIAFLDWCVLGGGELSQLDERIHKSLFPDLPIKLAEYIELCTDQDSVKLERDWRNKKCDVLSMWCHIYYGGDIFVTSDKNFFKKLPPLLEIGVGDILRPCDALARIREHLT